MVLAVCTGASLLYQTGILKNHKVTTYWLASPELANNTDIVINEERLVKSGKVWKSGGISSGIDLIFELINGIAGKNIAGQMQLLFEYFPNKKIIALTII
ncbi:MAG: DJ-1/PfpI family protein [Gammaproteobacteria bacterium]|nr:DJ-1/PfpI family protein [Gammaproteobacteria bacterium]